VGQLPEVPSQNARFQQLLLEFSNAASKTLPSTEILRLFCRSVRSYFEVSGAYIWQFVPPDQLEAVEADGWMAEQLLRVRLKTNQSAIVIEAIRKQKPILVNSVDPAVYPMAAQFQTKSLLAVPLIVFSEVIGAAVFTHISDSNFFTEDHAAKATILAGQLGSLLEAARLSREKKEEKRRTEILADVAESFRDLPDSHALIDLFVDHLRVLLRTRLVCLYGREAGGFRLWAVGADDSAMANSVRARQDRKGFHFASDIAHRAISAGGLISISVNPASHSIGEFVPAGTLLAVPFRTSSKEGAVLVYPRHDGAFTSEEKKLLPVITSFAAVAISNAELYGTARAQAQELQQILNIAAELGSISDLGQFMARLIQKACEFLGFERAFVGVIQNSALQVHWSFRDGKQGPGGYLIPDGVLTRAILNKETFWTDDASKVTGVNAEIVEQFNIRQLLVVPLLGAEGKPIGAFGVLDQRGQEPIKQEDIRRTQALAAHMAVALENARFFTRMEQTTRHWVETFDAIADFIVAHDEAGNVLRVNRALADFIGVQPQQLIGLNMSTLLATGTPGPLSLSCPFCRPTGDLSDEYVHPALERTFLVSTSQVHAASSEGLHTVHVLKDITDRREAERRYRELFDNIQEGLFFCSPNGRFVEVNDALVRMLGRSSREELLHCDPRQEIFLSPEQHASLFAALEQAGALHNGPAVLKRKDGSPVHVLINAFAVQSTHGQISQYRGLILDISGLKAYQAELQRERDFSGKILNNTQNLILVVDAAGLVNYANRRWQVMGYEQESIIGKPLASLVAPAGNDAFREAYAATLSGNQVDNLDLQILRSDRRIGQFSVNLSPMRDDRGQVSSIVVVMSDVTDAASLQSKLMHTEKLAAVGQLVSGVAHEVNNPLTAILGFADLLMENPEIPESARRDLRVILQEAQRTKQIVQNLLSFARQMPPQRKPLQLNPILRRTVQLRAYDLQSRGVCVNEDLRDPLPLVIGDPHQLQQVFLNILNNAYDAVRDKEQAARIEISTRSTNQFIEVTFRDNGCGISEPDRIFDPFFTTKQVGEGTGLGLSICYGIVKEHRGEIVCQNNADGPGATFIIRLPRAPQRESVSAGGTQS